VVPVAYVVAAIAGLVFGAADQYLGSLAAGAVLGSWTWTVSGMSAPWLVAPFVAGMTQDRRRRAMALGLVVTLAALMGYFAMSHSPMEGVPIEHFFGRVFTMVRTGYNPLWIAGGIVTGPLFGLLGHRWRVARSWISAALVTCALCLEPLAWSVAGMRSGPPAVWGAEIAIGIAVAVSFAIMIAASRRARETVPSLLPSGTRRD
jgi:uncharacterized protein DUF6518